MIRRRSGTSSHEDRTRRLAAIEQALMIDDPPSARRFARHRSVRRRARRIIVYVFSGLYVVGMTIAFVPGPFVMIAFRSIPDGSCLLRHSKDVATPEEGGPKVRPWTQVALV